MEKTESSDMKEGVYAYCRVSSDGQSLEHQRREVLDAVPRGLQKPAVLEEKASGANDDRPQYNKLKRLISAGRVQHLYVWALDRLGRTGKEMRAFIELCLEHKVNLVSVKEKVDFSAPFAPIVVACLTTMAQMERERISERTKA